MNSAPPPVPPFPIYSNHSTTPNPSSATTPFSYSANYIPRRRTCSLPVYAHYLHQQLAGPPAKFPYDGSTLTNPFDINVRRPEFLEQTYDLIAAVTLDAIADYKADAAPIAPALAAELHASYLSHLFDKREPPDQLNSTQAATFMMFLQVREKVPLILETCGAAAAPAAAELDAAIRAAIAKPPDDFYTLSGSSFRPSQALAAVAPKYQPTIDFLLSELTTSESAFVAWYNQNPPPTESEAQRLLYRASTLAQNLDNIDPTNAALRAAAQPDPPTTKPPDTNARAHELWKSQLRRSILNSDPATLDGIIDRLNHPFGRNRPALIQQLSTFGPAAAPAIPAILNTLYSPWQNQEPGLDDACFDLLATFGPKAWSAVPHLQNYSPGMPSYPSAQRALAAIGLDHPEPADLRDQLFLQSASSTVGIHFTSVDEAIDSLITRFPPNGVAEMRLVATLGPRAHRAIPALIALLPTNPNSNSPREYAAEALSQIAPPYAKEVIPQIEQYVHHPDARFRTDIIGLMAHLGPDAIPYLLDAVNDKNEFVRGAAIEGFLHMNPAASPDLPAIILAHRSADWPLFLDRLPELNAPPALILPDLRMLLKSSYSLRSRAADALGNLGRDAAPARAELEQHRLGDVDPAVRKAAAAALPKIPAP